MATIDLMTVVETRKAIRAAKHILIQARFGTSEQWVQLRKVDALSLLRAMHGSPRQNEMYSGTFGSIEGDTVYLG
jgi:hypothetical protein